MAARTLDQAGEAAGQVVRMQRCTVRGGEYVAGLLPPLPRRSFGLLPFAVGAQQPHGMPIEGDGAATGRGLGRPNRDVGAVGESLLSDHDDLGLEVDIDPAQPGRLTAAQPAQGNQPPHRIQPVVSDVVEEASKLLDGPHRHGEALPGLPPLLHALVGPDLACGRRGDGSSTCRAGLSRSSPSRIAALSAERSLARMRCSVDGSAGGVPDKGGRDCTDHVRDLSLHTHPVDETMYLLDGEILLHLDGQEHTVRAGGLAFAPRGVPHAFMVLSEVTRLITIHTPGTCEAFYYWASEPIAADGSGPVDFDRIYASARENGGVEILGPPPFTPAP